MKLFVALVVAASVAWGTLGADEDTRLRVTGERAVAAGAVWRATLEARPAPRAVPRVVAVRASAQVGVRVRRTAAGRYALRATFPRAGRWRLAAQVGGRRHALGSVVVSAPPVRLRSVLALELDRGGGVLIADGDSAAVVRADLATGRLTRLASGPMRAPTGLAVATDGTVYVADRHAGAVFRIRGGAVRRVAAYPDALDVALDRDGTLFVTGRPNTVVRVAPGSGVAAPYAGTGVEGSTGDGGPALGARIAAPHGIAVDPAGNVVVAELTSVRRIDRATNVIERIAGTGTERRACGERGPALSVCFTALRLAFEPGGDFYVTDPENSRLWLVSGGEARAFRLGFAPFDVAVESDTTVLLADDLNRRVVRFDLSTGAVTTVVG